MTYIANDNEGPTEKRIVGIKAIASVLDVDESTVKRYARRPRVLGGVIVRPRLELSIDHADRVFIGAHALDRWRAACVRPHQGTEPQPRAACG